MVRKSCRIQTVFDLKYKNILQRLKPIMEAAVNENLIG